MVSLALSPDHSQFFNISQEKQAGLADNVNSLYDQRALVNSVRSLWQTTKTKAQARSKDIMLNRSCEYWHLACTNTGYRYGCNHSSCTHMHTRLFFVDMHMWTHQLKISHSARFSNFIPPKNENKCKMRFRIFWKVKLQALVQRHHNIIFRQSPTIYSTIPNAQFLTDVFTYSCIYAMRFMQEISIDMTNHITVWYRYDLNVNAACRNALLVTLANFIPQSWE